MSNNLIFGKDATERIVSIDLKDDKVHLYTQCPYGSGKVNVEIFDYLPYVLSHGAIRSHSEKLTGNQYWNYITSTTCEKFQALSENYQRELWLPRTLEDCYMLAEGTTLYKGMKVQDVSILSFDIETSGLAFNEDSQVFCITNTFRKDGILTRRLFSIDNYPNQREMIIDWTDWVRKIDPSIMCGHNIMSYDFPYLNWCFSRYDRTNDNLNLGRDGSEIQIATKLSKFRKDAQQQYEYHNIRITGRQIVDTFFLSIKHDATLREFPSYGLKPIINHLGLEKKDRTFIEAGRIAEYWKDQEMREKVKQYAIEDSDDALTLFDKFIPPYFYMCNSIPKTLQQMIGEATGSQLDALMVRSYLQDGGSQPKTTSREDFEGAISFGVPGLYDWVAKADVAALYPSIMLQYDIYDKKKDPNRHILKALEYFRSERLKHKQLFKETKDLYHDGIQAAFKILANSIYGFMGSNFLLYNCPYGAAEVTRKGRDVLQTAINYATGYAVEKVVKHVKNAGKENEESQFEWRTGQRNGLGMGFNLAGVDTDSIWITNGNPITKENFKLVLTELNKQFPEMIKFEDDGIYSRFIVLKTKNYITVKDGEMKLKGSGLVDMKKEAALREMMKKMFQALVANEISSLPLIYKDYVKEVVDIKDISRWCFKKTVTQSVLHPERLTERKVLDALNEACKEGKMGGFQEGDKVWIYNALDGEKQSQAKGELVFYKDGRPKMEKNNVLKHPALWKKDQDIEHYLKRVYTCTEILGNIIPEEMFPDYSKKSKRAELEKLNV